MIKISFRKFLAIILAFAITLCFTACNKEDTTDDDGISETMDKGNRVEVVDSKE